MPTNYTGNEANITPRASVVLQEPVDGDARNAASVNTALSRIADLLQHLEQRAVLLNQANTIVAPAGNNGLNVTAGGGGFTGLVATGGPTGAGVAGFPGTAATASTPQVSMVAGNGYYGFNGAVNPNSTVGFANILTPLNIPKVWANFTTAGGVVTINDAFNVTSISLSGGLPVVTFASPMLNSSYAIIATVDVNGGALSYSGKGTSSFEINGTYWNGSTMASINFTSLTTHVSLAVFGRQ